MECPVLPKILATHFEKGDASPFTGEYKDSAVSDGFYYVRARAACTLHDGCYLRVQRWHFDFKDMCLVITEGKVLGSAELSKERSICNVLSHPKVFHRLHSLSYLAVVEALPLEEQWEVHYLFYNYINPHT